jgi:2-phosphosulfolactate phosphatase
MLHLTSVAGSMPGAEALLDRADAFVVVDVLSFSTCVDVTCSNGAQVFPFPIHDREGAH